MVAELRTVADPGLVTEWLEAVQSSVDDPGATVEPQAAGSVSVTLASADLLLESTQPSKDRIMKTSAPTWRDALRDFFEPVTVLFKSISVLAQKSSSR